jgi:flagellar basal body rod protein FlgG
MSQGRAQFVCGAVFGLAIGFAVGHIALTGRGGPQNRSVPTTIEVALPRSQEPQLLAMAEGISDRNFEPFPADDVEAPRTNPGLINADAYRAEGDGSVGSEPKPLPKTSAAPIDSKTSQNAEELQEVLRDELDAATPQQREIWGDALEGVPAAEATEILRLWKLMGKTGSNPLAAVAPPGSGQLLPLPPPSNRTESLARPPRTLREAAPRVEATLRRNIAHQKTPGFRQSIPQIQAEINESGRVEVVVLGFQIDARKGEMIETGDQHHVAIAGSGFFQVVTPQGETLLTRCGSLVLDSEGRLLIESGGLQYPLDGSITIPGGCEEITIGQDGMISSKIGQDAVTIGKIDVWQVLRPSALAAAGGAFLRTTTSSGMPMSGLKGRLMQGMLEGSNTDVAEMKHWLECLDDSAQQGELVVLPIPSQP